MGRAVAVPRFMDSLPGFEDLPVPQSEYVAALRADRDYPSSLWRLFDGQGEAKSVTSGNNI